MSLVLNTFLGRFVNLEVQGGKPLKCLEGTKDWAAVCASNLAMEKLPCGEMIPHYGRSSSERKTRELDIFFKLMVPKEECMNPKGSKLILWGAGRKY